MTDVPHFRIGNPSAAHLVVRPTRRERPDATDFWDGNWLYATIQIAAGAFRGEFEAQLRAEEFVHFREQIRPLHEKLAGHASFVTTEDWLTVEIDGDGRGHFHAACVAIDQPGTGNHLTFGIDFDQTDLPEILRGLDAVCKAFPVMGRP